MEIFIFRSSEGSLRSCSDALDFIYTYIIIIICIVSILIWMDGS